MIGAPKSNLPSTHEEYFFEWMHYLDMLSEYNTHPIPYDHYYSVWKR